MYQKHNVIVITIDSCRYDTAQLANTPNLNKISQLKKAETSGTYTYPAHHSFFMGDFPRIIDIDDIDYLKGYDQIWRSKSARKSSKKVFLNYEGPNIIKYYEEIGYNVQGFGGVQFFNTYNKNNVLPNIFKNFHYFNRETNLSPDKRLPRTKTSFPLCNIDLLVKKTNTNKPYFLFINCPETHIPYDVPNSNINSVYKNLISRIYKEQISKKRYKQNNLPFTKDEINILKKQQIDSLEWVDKQIGTLLKKLAFIYPTIIIACADHGEEFGDNGRFGHAHCDNSVFIVPVWSNIHKKNIW